ncbi:MAG: hypothetical protein ABJO67_15110 [Pseudoruegeria sp.]
MRAFEEIYQLVVDRQGGSVAFAKTKGGGCLVVEGIVDQPPISLKAFNTRQDESGRSLTEISRVQVLSSG